MRYLLILVLGVLLGGGAAVFFLGTPRAGSAPGVRVKAPDQGGDPPGTVTLSLDQGFVDAVLNTTFSNLGSPTFHLSQKDQTSQQHEHEDDGQQPKLLTFSHKRPQLLKKVSHRMPPKRESSQNMFLICETGLASRTTR